MQKNILHQHLETLHMQKNILHQHSERGCPKKMRNDE